MASLNLFRAFGEMGYDPHEGQRAIHKSTSRHRLAACGRRFGKSKLGGHELTVDLIHGNAVMNDMLALGRQRIIWIVGPNYDDVEKEFRVLWNDIKRLKIPVQRPGSYNNAQGGLMQVTAWDGTWQVLGKSAAHEDSLDGEGLSYVLMVEAAKMKPVIWDKYIRPALADNRGGSLHTSTPEGRNHFYEHWQRGQDPDEKDWQSWRMPSWRNLKVFPGGRKDPEILAVENDMSTEKFNQEFGADFSDFVGRVFKDFDEEIHVGDFPYDPRYPVYGACDYGFTNPFVWLDIQVDVWDNVYILSEYYATQTDINDIARDLLDAGKSNCQMFYPDPEAPGDTRVLTKKLRVPFESNTGGPLQHRLERIRQKLKLRPDHLPWDQRKPQLYIDRRCVRLIDEMNSYRYPESKSETREEPEKPMKKHDHGPEALGRFMRGYYGPIESDDARRRNRATMSMVTARR